MPGLPRETVNDLFKIMRSRCTRGFPPERWSSCLLAQSGALQSFAAELKKQGTECSADIAQDMNTVAGALFTEGTKIALEQRRQRRAGHDAEEAAV